MSHVDSSHVMAPHGPPMLSDTLRILYWLTGYYSQPSTEYIKTIFLSVQKRPLAATSELGQREMKANPLYYTFDFVHVVTDSEAAL